MAKKVENKDLFADDLMGKTIKDVELLIVELDKLEAKIVTVAKAQKTILEKEDFKSIGSIQRTTKAVNELSEAEKMQQNLLKQKQTLETKLKSARTVQAQQNAETNLLLQQQNKIIKDAAKESLGLTNAYTKLTAQTNKAQANFKKLAAEFGVNSKQAKAAKIEFDKLDNRLRSINNAARDGRRDVGRYGLAFQKVGGVLKSGLGFLGITAGIGAVSSVISGAFTTIKDFEQSIADLGAITGATGTDLDKFQKEVLRVSKSTGKGAVDIAKAFQIVGSAQPELLSSAAALGSVTEAAVLLSKAGNIDVPEAANSLALAMNQFGASALEAASYTDILATSQQKGTATIPQLSESLKNVGSVARASGLSFETTNAALQGLAKGGLVGAEAGTKLRTILLRLAKTGRDDLNPATQKFSDILGVLKKEVGTVTDAQKLFGEEAAAAALTLINQKQVIEDLDGALNVNGAALEQAAQRYNTITGRNEKLTATYERFLITLNEGGGILDNTIGKLQGMAQALLDNIDLDERLSKLGLSRGFFQDFDLAAYSVLYLQENIDKVISSMAIAGAKSKDYAIAIKKLREEFDKTGTATEEDVAKRKVLLQSIQKLLEQQKGLKAVVKDSNDDTTTTTELTKEQTDALKKRNDELERYKRQLRDSQVNLLDDDLKQSIERIKNKFNDEIELVKGNSKIEIELRKSLELEKLQAVDEVIEKYKIKSKEMKKADDLNLKIRTDLQNVKTPSDILEEENKKIEEQMRVRKELTEAGLQIIEDLVNNYYEKQLTALDKQLDKTGERVDYLRGKAQNSMLASEESLAFEQKKEAELEQQRIKTQKEQQKMQALMTVISTYNSKVNANDPTPLQSTIRDLGVLRALAGTLQGFYEGTDDVGKSLGKPQLSGKDGHIIRVDGKEQIWSAKDRAAVGFRDRDEIKDIVSIFDNGILNDLMKYDKSNEVINPSAFAMNGMSIKMISKLEQISENIKGIKIPEGTVSIDEVKKLITLTIKNGNTIKKERSKLFD